MKKIFKNKKFITIFTIIISLYFIPKIINYFIKNNWEIPPIIVPIETSDEETLSQLFNYEEIPIFKDDIYVFQSSSMRKEYPRIFYDFIHNYLEQNNVLFFKGNLDANNFICKSINSNISLWKISLPLFDLKECPETYIKGVVLSRFEGSGKMIRFWFTQATIGMVDDEVLRIYVDENQDPFIQIPLKKLYDGSLGEIFSAPFGAQASQYILWYYPVVFSSKLILTLDNIGPIDHYYHQTNVKLDSMKKKRIVPDTKLEIREKVKSFIFNYNSKTYNEFINYEYNSNEKIEKYNLNGSYTIHQLELEFDKEDISNLSNSILSINWDNSEKEAINLSLKDLFMLYGNPPQSSGTPLSFESRNNKYVAKFSIPMPFKKNAEILINNTEYKGKKYNFRISGIDKIPSKNFGYFHIESNETKSPNENLNHRILNISNQKGKFVGVCAYLEGRNQWRDEKDQPFLFLEGDENINIDNKYLFSGTGTEDYFNSSYYYSRGNTFSIFSSNWNKEEKKEYSSVNQCRWQILPDSIDFRESFQFDLEIGPQVPSTLNYYKTNAYYYSEQ